MDRWVTFDCYGTLIDWNQGIGATLSGLWPQQDRDELVACYHRHRTGDHSDLPRLAELSDCTDLARVLAASMTASLPE